MSQHKVFAVGSIIRMQILLGVIGFLLMALLGLVVYAASYVYGIGLMVVNGCWLAFRLARAGELAAEDGQQLLYVGAAFRFLALIAGLLMAQLLGLHLLVVAAGMFAAQAVLFIFTVCEYSKATKGQNSER